jgi:hypothetical protein
MYVRVRGIDFTFIYDFLLDFVIVPTVGYLLAFFSLCNRFIYNISSKFHYMFVLRKVCCNSKDNDQRKKIKRTNNDLQNTTQKTKDRARRASLKYGSELRYYGGLQFLLHYGAHHVIWD